MTEASTTARMQCREIMTSSVKTATRDTPLQEVARLMRDGDHDIHAAEQGRDTKQDLRDHDRCQCIGRPL